MKISGNLPAKNIMQGKIKKEIKEEKAGTDSLDIGSNKSKEQQEILELKGKIGEMRETARKSYLLGAAGAFGLGLTAAVSSPILRLALAAGSTVALFKGCQKMYDKVMHDF